MLDLQVACIVLNTLNGLNPTFAGPVGALKVRLMTELGSPNWLGTELATGAGTGSGPGYTIGGKAITFDYADLATGTAHPTADITWTNMPATKLVGVEVWEDAAGRWHIGALTRPVVLTSGETYTLAKSMVVVKVS